ncbi:hypothetical protein H5410_056881 [Solanum commersonii]|uniref:Uncharacterized protein n=1 Tax=Solanum commersonii TaxID=4109 RepID=A0A9J5WLG0_SOLCO|nr:hypothetical protein H5410_056881 [Solanum commersonii]
MANTYEKVSGKYLINVIRRFVFSERIIDMIYEKVPTGFGMKNKGHLEDFKKAAKMMNVWQNRLMTYGEAMNPPVSLLYQLLFDKFF